MDMRQDMSPTLTNMRQDIRQEMDMRQDMSPTLTNMRQEMDMRQDMSPTLKTVMPPNTNKV